MALPRLTTAMVPITTTTAATTCISMRVNPSDRLMSTALPGATAVPVELWL
jgi:hypothetical protein